MFELFLAAQWKNGGAVVELAEPDILLHLDGAVFQVECKRPFYQRSVWRNIEDGASQLGKALEKAGRFQVGGADEDKRGGCMNVLRNIWNWAKGHIVIEVSEDDALCEFDCRKPQCAEGELGYCTRRLQQAAGELMPTKGTSSDAVAESMPSNGLIPPKSDGL
jgi:hypothetical protein